MDIDFQRNFGKRECPSCGVEVAENNNRCPICKYEFPSQTAGEKGFRLTVGLFLLLLFCLMVFGLIR